jgi:hypothetical protein
MIEELSDQPCPRCLGNRVTITTVVSLRGVISSTAHSCVQCGGTGRATRVRAAADGIEISVPPVNPRFTPAAAKGVRELYWSDK